MITLKEKYKRKAISIVTDIVNLDIQKRVIKLLEDIENDNPDSYTKDKVDAIERSNMNDYILVATHYVEDIFENKLSMIKSFLTYNILLQKLEKFHKEDKGKRNEKSNADNFFGNNR